MDNHPIVKRLIHSGVLLGALSLWGGAVPAAEFWLCAGQATKNIVDGTGPGTDVDIWGFAQVAGPGGQGPGCGATADIPGPQLLVPDGDDTLTVHLYNDGLPEGVSIVIPTQIASMTPTRHSGGTFDQRVRSFTAETAAGATTTYTWGSAARPFRPGTHIYHSGTHPAVQVQMGLYGGVTKNFAPGIAYPGVDYEHEVALFYSEIDPALHAAVAGGTYGTVAGPTSTIDYQPKYFLVNGQPFSASTPDIAAGMSGERTLLRFFNMGLRSFAPMLQSEHMQVVAEDAYPYTYPREQYAILLPAGKTKDAIFEPLGWGQFPLFDRRLNLTNAQAPNGGLLSFLEIDPPPNSAPTVNAGVDQTVTLPSLANLAGTVNDDGLPVPPGIVTTTWSTVSGPGTVTFGNANALSTSAGFSVAGTYVLRLSADDGGAPTVTDDVQVTVNPVPPSNQPPTVSAGADQAVTLPSTAPLAGTVNDDGLPNPPGIVTTTWSTVSGPGTVTFGNANALSTSAGFSAAGTYVLRLSADDGGAPAVTDDVQVTVNPAPPNAPPTVNAGADQAVTLPSAAPLAGTVNDDGLPNPPGIVTTTWSKVSGPGTVTFGNVNAPSTSASFSAAGSYVLRLTANDGGAPPVIDDVVVTVNPQPSSRATANLSVLYTFDQGAGATVFDVSGVGAALNLNIENPGNAQRTGAGGLLLQPATRVSNGLNANKLYNAATLSNELTIEAWVIPANTVQGGPGRMVTQSADSGNRNFTLGQGNGNYEARLRTTTNGNNGYSVRLISGPVTANGQPQHVVFTRAANGTAKLYVNNVEVDSDTVGGNFSNWNANYDFALGNEFNTTSTNTQRDWQGEYRLVAVYTRALTVAEVTQNFNAGPDGQPPVNVAPTVNAGADQAVTLPSAAPLAGTVTDDGLPVPPGSVTTSWSKVSGPSTVAFGNVNALSTSASFGAAGTYVLRLSATDGALPASDDVQVIVNPAPPNAPPTVNAGADQAVTLPSLANLAGTVTDDGLPVPPGNVTTTWSKFSGPGTVTFGNAAAANTSASFSVAGTYVLRLTANDGGAPAVTDDVQVTVNPAPPNAPPTVNAGADQAVTLPSAAPLAATVNDDGLPVPPGNVTTTWSKVSGPGTVTFGNVNAPSTSASFSAAGTYVLRLTANDGGAPAVTDDVTVTVSPQPPSSRATANLSVLYTFDQGAGATVFDVSGVGAALNLNIENPGNTQRTGAGGLLVQPATRVSNGLNTNKLYSAATLSNELTIEAWVIPANTVQGGPGRMVTQSADSGNRNFTLGQGNGNYEARLRTTTNGNNGYSVRLISGPVTANGQPQHVVFTRAANGTAKLYVNNVEVDSDTVGGNFSNWNANYDFALGNEFNTTSTNTQRDWQGEYRLVAVYTRALTVAEVTQNFNAGPDGQPPVNVAPTVNAGADQAVTLPSAAPLAGTVTDDGLPVPPGSVTTTWSKVSGPSTVAFGNVNALSTSASFGAAGTYVLRLSATDGALPASDDVQVIVNPAPPNAPPTVNAGADQTVTLPSLANLAGTVTDDGLPVPPGNVTTTWSKFSGPGTVTFGNAAAANTSASFSVAGTYVLRLTANDGGAPAVTDDVQVTVNPAPPNAPPTVNAGADQAVTLPSAAPLAGTVNDDGLPVPPGNVTTTWSKVSGPGTVTFGNVNAPSTSASFSAAGTYVLRLTANDGGAPAVTDDVQVIVNPSSRATANLSVLYTFDQGAGATVFDVSGVGAALNLNIENPGNTQRTGAGGLLVQPATRVSNGLNTNKLYSAATASNELTVEAWVIPANTVQGGPGRMVTQSADSGNRNFTLGQGNGNYEARLRTTTNGNNGYSVRLISGPVTANGQPQHVVFTRAANGTAKLYVNNVEVDSDTVGGNFSNWNANYDFALGNEFNTTSTNLDRDWQGEYRLVAVYTRALTAAEVTQNFNAGP